MGKYKFGKKEEILPFHLAKQKVINANLRLRDEAFFWFLYYCGVRKSEAYERVAGDFKKSATHLIVDFHRRKKGGAEVPPLRLPLNWYGIDKIVLSARIALSCRPKEKAVYVYKNGKRVRIVKGIGRCFHAFNLLKHGK